MSVAPARAFGLPDLERAGRLLADRLAVVGVLGILSVALLIVTDVLLRWLTSAPIRGMNEVIQVTLAVAIAAVFPAGVSRRVHLSIDMLSSRFPRKFAAWLPVAGDTALLAMLGVFAWQVGLYAQELGSRAAQTPYLGLPQAPFIWCVSVLLAISCVLQLVALLARAGEVQAGDSRLGWAAAIAVLVCVVVVLGLGWRGLAALAETRQNNWLTLSVFLLLWVVAFLEIPLGAVMALLGLWGTIFLMGWEPALGMIGSEAPEYLMNPNLATLPLFLMMGSFAVAAGLSVDIYNIAHAIFGRVRAGLAMATILACGGFGTLTGSSLAASATIGGVSLPEMRKRGYSPGLATGCVAAGGTLGQLVPPSTAAIVYCILAEESIGKIFIAMVVPAILAIALYLLTIIAYVRYSPASVPPADSSDARSVWATLKRSWVVVALFLVVLGGIYGGVFTATEAAAVGAVGTFLTALARGKLSGRTLWSVIGDTTETTAMIYILIFGAVAFSFFIGVSGAGENLVAWVKGLGLPPMGVIIVLLLIYTALGCVMDSFPIMVITVPIVAPLITSFGYDLVWWGVVMVIVVETGFITPPFGLNVFILKGMAPDVPMGAVFRGVIPFVAADLVKLAFTIAFPALALWLPSTMR